MTSTPNKIYTTNLMCGHPILHHQMQPRALILEHFNMFQSFLFLLSLQQMMRLRFSTSCQHSCHYVQPQYAHMHSCHNGERSSMYRLTSLFSYHHDYFICMKLETSPKKVRRFFLNFCRFGRSSVLERLLELVRLWKATASLDFTVGFCCFSSNSWTSL